MLFGGTGHVPDTGLDMRTLLSLNVTSRHGPYDASRNGDWGGSRSSLESRLLLFHPRSCSRIKMLRRTRHVLLAMEYHTLQSTPSGLWTS